MTFPTVTELVLEPLTADGFAVVVSRDSQSNAALTPGVSMSSVNGHRLLPNGGHRISLAHRRRFASPDRGVSAMAVARV